MKVSLGLFFYWLPVRLQQYDVRRGGESMDPTSMVVRLHDVGFPLLVAAAEWCPFEQEPTYGFLLKNEDISRIRKETGRNIGFLSPMSILDYLLHRPGLRPGDQVIKRQRAECDAVWSRRGVVIGCGG